MKPERALIAAGRAAQHCSALLHRGPAPTEQLAHLKRTGERLAPLLARMLAPLLGGDPPTVTVLPPRETGEGEFAAEVGSLAMNCLYASGVPGATLLASIDGRATLGLVDRAFGGKGVSLQPLPAAFPLSAELLIARIEARLGACLAVALAHPDLAALRRHPQLSELAPYPAGCRLGVLQLEVMEEGGPSWRISFAMPMVTLPRLLGLGTSAGTSRMPRGPADPAAAPFAEVPLTLTAVLVDMAVPLAAISALAPGTVLPITVSRAVPLLAGTAILARGSAGTEDDRLALRITRIA
jgi:flagellar motor switch protein FliM